MYYFLDHTADIKIVITNNNLLDFFNDLLLSLNELVNYTKNDQEKIRKIKIILNDLYNYQKIFNFINKFIYFIEVKSLLLLEVESINLKRDYWELKVIAIKVDKQKIKGYLKAPTYHQFIYDSLYNLEVIIDV